MMESLQDLDLADDICLLAQRRSDIEAKLEKLEKEAGKMRLKVREFKTKEIRVTLVQIWYLQ